MLDHCLRCWPNIKTTLDRRFTLFEFNDVAFKRFLLAQVDYCASICTLTHLRKYLRTCILSHLRKYLRTCALTHFNMYSLTCTSTCTLLHTCNTCASTCSHTHLHKYLRKHFCTFASTSALAYLRTLAY